MNIKVLPIMVDKYCDKSPGLKSKNLNYGQGSPKTKSRRRKLWH
jgi:hypothetical protein